ncbi:MAG: ABC transporter permease [Chloroflexi bacterium]|nr:MAG: ABC transporter permease [Chloroflexota bacterium]MBL1194409.1 ABC transporter permease [Chloroflexota bacterium]NOH11697.1 ABC transporter permease [Chloroflexota bacterium]
MSSTGAQLSQQSTQRYSAFDLLRHRWSANFLQFCSSWDTFRRNPLGIVGLTIILIFAISSFIHPMLIGTVWPERIYDPMKGFDIELIPHPTAPSSEHLLGTDNFGRDILSQLVFAARSSFLVGLGAAVVAVSISTLVGGMAGYFGGMSNAILMGVADVFVLAPAPIILLIFGLIVTLEVWHIILLYGILVGLGGQAIVVKSHTLTIATKTYIDVARLSGGGHFHILRQHILPALMPLALVQAVFTVVGAVLTESLLSFYARSNDVITWGSMIFLNQRTFRWFTLDGQWHAIIWPALAIMLFCSSFYLVGRALDEIVNPKLRKR